MNWALGTSSPVERTARNAIGDEPSVFGVARRDSGRVMEAVSKTAVGSEVKGVRATLPLTLLVS